MVGADSVVNILTGLPHWHRYTWAGDFIETIHAPSMSGMGQVAIGPDGVLVSTTQGPEGGRLVLWRPGMKVRIVNRGLLWAWTVLPDPDAPSTPRPPPQSPGEIDLEVTSRYRDYVLEVLSTDGRLIATRRFDRVQDVARGVSAGFWVRTEDDALQTLTIVEPVLVRPRPTHRRARAIARLLGDRRYGVRTTRWSRSSKSSGVGPARPRSR